jgi:hypothetical protein
MYKQIRKALTSAIFIIIGIILIINPLAWQYGLFFGPLGVLSIIVGMAYWLYIWPDETPSGKEMVEENLALSTNENIGSSQGKNLENITQAGFYHGVNERNYFGGVDHRPNPPKEK